MGERGPLARAIAAGLGVVVACCPMACLPSREPRSTPPLLEPSALEVASWSVAGDDSSMLPRETDSPLDEAGSEVDPMASLAERRPVGLRVLQVAARRRHPSVEEWQARGDAAEARATQARARFFPTLRSDGQLLVLEDEIGFADPLGNQIVVQDRRQYTQRTQLALEVFDWGARRHAYRARQQEIVAENASERRRLQELDFQVARVYWGVLEARGNVDVLRASIESLAGSLARGRDLIEVGRLVESDILLVEASLESRQLEARTLEDLVESLAEDLALLVDRPLATRFDLEIPEGLPETPGDDTDPEDRRAFWEGVALVARPELLALDAGHEALSEIRQATARSFLPAVQLFAQHEHSTTESAFRNPDLFSGGVNVAWDLFRGGETRALIDEYEARSRELRAQHRQLVGAIRSEVGRALRDMDRSRDAVEVSGRVVERARKNLDRVAGEFAEGRATAQELLEAESLLRGEQARAERAKYSVYRARAGLRLAVGLDLDEELEPAGD